MFLEQVPSGGIHHNLLW